MSSSAFNVMKQPSHPLTEAEIKQAGGLLMRAVKHGQTTSISKYMLVAKEKSSIIAAATHFTESVTEAMGSMTDGSKRRRDLEDPDDTVSSCQDWDHVSDVGVFTPKKSESKAYPGPVTYTGGCGSLATPMPGKHQPSGVENGEDITVPIPEGNINAADWGLTFCDLDKVKDRNLRYSEMVILATSEPDMHRYLKFIQSSFGKNAKTKVTDNYTGGVDLAAYLDRIRWTATAVKPASFQRRK